MIEHGGFVRMLSRWIVVLAALGLPVACSNGGGGGKKAVVSDQVKVTGRLLDVRGDPVGGVPVEALGSDKSDRTSGDGTFTVTVPRADPRILVGGEDHAAFVARIAVDGGAGVRAVSAKRGVAGGASEATAATSDQVDVGRPFFLEFLDDGFATSVASGKTSEALVIDDPSIPGLSLQLASGTTVSYPEGFEETITLLGVSGDRLPLPFPENRLARMAVHVGPLGLELDRAAQLALPNADGLAPGTAADLARLDVATGSWRLIGELRVDRVGEAILGGEILEGGFYAALPRVRLPRTSIVGRIVGSGNEPVGGYQILTQGSHSTVSASDGNFEIADMPVFPDTEFRLQAVPPLKFRHEFITTALRAPQIAPGTEIVSEAVVDPDTGETTMVETAVTTDPETDFGKLSVGAVLRSSFPPTVRYSPGNGARNVDEVVRVSVTFNARMDLGSVGLKLVRGISRKQGGVKGTSFLRFPGADVTQLEFVPVEPLQNGEFYTIFIPKGARDIQGIPVSEESVSSRFTVRANRAEITERELRVHSVVPNQGFAGDEIEIFGENLNPEAVRFGSAEAFVVDFDDTTRDFLVVRVPDGLAGEVPVEVRNLDGSFQGGVPFRAAPFIDSLDVTVVPASGEGAGRVTGRGMQLGGSPAVFWNGLRGGSVSGITDEEICPAALLEQEKLQCLEITLPDGVLAGSLYLEVEGIRTRGFFVVRQRAVDTTPPRVASSNVSEGATVDVRLTLEVTFTEAVSRNARARVEADGRLLRGLTQSVVYGADGTSRLEIAPPSGGWPTGGALRLVAGSSIVDLAGNPLDQEVDTPDSSGRQNFEVGFEATSSTP